jgi:hypothetical protein
MLALEVVPLRRGPADGARGWTLSVATMPASPTSPTRTATSGPCRNAVTARHDSLTRLKGTRSWVCPGNKAR